MKEERRQQRNAFMEEVIARVMEAEAEDEATDPIYAALKQARRAAATIPEPEQTTSQQVTTKEATPAAATEAVESGGTAE